jgi:hypothetical protein
MSNDKAQTDYSNTLLRYHPGKGWSPMDYTPADEPESNAQTSASPETTAHGAARDSGDANAHTSTPRRVPSTRGKVIHITPPATEEPQRSVPPVSGASPVGKAASLEQAELDSWLQQAAQAPDYFGVDEMETASLETLGERLPEMFIPLDQYADEANNLSWDDVAHRISTLQTSIEERDRYALLLAEAELQITEVKRDLFGKLHDIQRQERTKAAAAQLRERMSALTAQQVAKRLRQILAK